MTSKLQSLYLDCTDKNFDDMFCNSWLLILWAGEESSFLTKPTCYLHATSVLYFEMRGLRIASLMARI